MDSSVLSLASKWSQGGREEQIESATGLTFERRWPNPVWGPEIGVFRRNISFRFATDISSAFRAILDDGEEAARADKTALKSTEAGMEYAPPIAPHDEPAPRGSCGMITAACASRGSGKHPVVVVGGPKGGRGYIAIQQSAAEQP